MAEITLHGAAGSTFVRTARMACAEKGVGHRLVPADLRSAAHRALHPFGRMPVMQHGDYTLYETRAIAGYIDDAFDGPRLTPAAARPRAEMEKWISVSNSYVDAVTVRQFVIERLAAEALLGRKPDEDAIAAALPRVADQLALMDRELAARPFLAGEALSLADLFLAPIVAYVGMAPEGAGLLAGKDHLRRWYGAMAERPSFAATAPKFG
ncbi:MAG: glutathione S-transferase family protein [Rhodospirillales bacterium]